MGGTNGAAKQLLENIMQYKLYILLQWLLWIKHKMIYISWNW